jgi:PIN domain nuclease of toxin-antitoxin system
MTRPSQSVAIVAVIAPCIVYDEAAGFLKRLVTFAAVRRLGTLPAHHKDPFDRILVAQALEEGAPMVSGDPLIARYPIQVLW